MCTIELDRQNLLVRLICLSTFCGGHGTHTACCPLTANVRCGTAFSSSSHSYLSKAHPISERQELPMCSAISTCMRIALPMTTFPR
jgi:hypothetical protein